MRDAGLYLRISKDLTGEGLAVDRQRTDGMRLITGRGWKLHREYVDNDISAAGRRKRPAFEQMLRDVAAGHITVIVALSLDRLTRNRRDQLRLVETCQEHGTLVALVRGSDIDMSSAVGRAMADMMSVWARMEIEQKSERHISQIAQAASAGRMVGGRRAFGYTADGLHLDPDEAPLVKRLYEMWLTGSSLSSMRRWLDGQGITTPRGHTWRNHSVREVIANPRNAGLRGMRDVVNKVTGTRSQWHRIVGPAVWPQIIPEEVWRATMAKLHDPARPGNHRGVYASKHMLTGIALCGVCSAAGRGDVRMVAGRRDGLALLRCSTGAHLGRRASYIEDFVEEQLLWWFTCAQGRAALGAATAMDSLGIDVEGLRTRSISLREKLRGLTADYVDGLLDRDNLRYARDRINAQLAEVDGQIGMAGQVDVVAGLLAAEDVEREWQDYDNDMKKEIIRNVMRITVLPGAPGRPGGARFDPASVKIEWLER